MSDRSISITFSTICFCASFFGYLANDFKFLVFFGMVGVAIAAFSKK